MLGHALRKTALLDKTIIRRIQKLGDYYGAARAVTDAMNLPSMRIHDLRASIRFTEIIPPQPTQHSMAANFLQIINAFADSIQSVRISWDELKDAYPSLGGKEEPTGDTAVTVSPHCECTIGNFMRNKLEQDGSSAKFFEIGISKYSCWFCEKYMELLEQNSSGFTDMKIVVTGYQGKFV